MDRMLDDRGSEQGIQDLKQGITTAAEGGIHGVTKGAQVLKGRCVHAAHTSMLGDTSRHV